MNDENMQSLHGTANDALVRLLFVRVRDMRSGASDFGPPAEALPGIAPVPTNAQGLAGQGGDIASNPGEIA